eukprot:g2724.t1
MQTRVSRMTTTTHFTPSRFIPIAQSNLHQSRSSRKPSLPNLSIINTSVTVLPSTAMSQAPLGMDVTRTSQEALVRSLKSSLRLWTPRVERVLLAVDRRHFVKCNYPSYVIYHDMPLPIGYDETISAPHMHATCLSLLENHAMGKSRVLDVGSGSGYLTAALGVLGGIGSTVLGVEKHWELAERSRKSIRKSNPDLLIGPNPRVRILAGNILTEVLEEMESFDAIHVGAAAGSIPQILINKLSRGGRMVIPIGPKGQLQRLMCIDKDLDGNVQETSLMGVRYVPLTEPMTTSGETSVQF